MSGNSQQQAERVRVGSLDESAALARARRLRTAADAAEAELLAVAAHWADLHPVTGTDRADGHTLWSGPGGRENLVPLAGAGTPKVAEFAPAELAAALGVSTDGGRRLVGDALELRHRLPKTWARIQAGDLQAWRGRRIAQATVWLPRQAAAYVDAHAAPYAHKLSPGRVDRLVEAAGARFCPDQTQQRAAEAADRRHVTVYDDTTLAGTARIDIETDALDAQTFDHTIGAIADQLSAFGDPDRVDLRRAKAVGVIADPQQALDLLTSHPDDTAEPAGDTRRTTRRAGTHLVIYLHLSETAITSLGTNAKSAGPALLGRRETTSCDVAMLAEQIRTWAGRDDINLSVKPVIDLNQAISVDAYEIPDRLTDRVTIRDRTCVFPWCERPARACDKDHTIAYHPAIPGDLGDDPGDDPGGKAPPGQTSSDNLTCLCRRHHRIKTHTGWSYTTLEPGTYLWTSPHGLAFLRDPTGTKPIDHRTNQPADLCSDRWSDRAHPPDS